VSAKEMRTFNSAQERLKEWSEVGDRADSVVVRASASNSAGRCSIRSVGEGNDNVQQRTTKAKGMECKKGPTG
jgi:hypothetical protein